MQVAANMMGHLEWQWRMSLQFWLVIVLRNTHAVGRIFGDSKDPVTLPLVILQPTQARAGSGTTRMLSHSLSSRKYNH